MKSAVRSEIERIIRNRYGEAHPFKRGSAGIEWFSRMLPLVDQLTVCEINGFLLPMVEHLLQITEGCFSCRAKLLVFAESFCSRRMPRKAMDYRKEYQAHLKNRRADAEMRNYRAEVHEAMALFAKKGFR